MDPCRKRNRRVCVKWRWRSDDVDADRWFEIEGVSLLPARTRRNSIMLNWPLVTLDEGAFGGLPGRRCPHCENELGGLGHEGWRKPSDWRSRSVSGPVRADTLITALQCITQTADGNAGFVRATIIYALCQVIHTSAWRDKGDALLLAMNEFSFIDAWSALSEGRERLYPGTISKALADQLSSHLSDRLSNSRAKKSRPTVAIPVPH